MKLSVKALAITTAILWGFAVLIMSIANQLNPDYGVAFLDVVSSVYPGYQTGQGINSILIGTVYAVIDGAIGGAIVAWVYNKFV